MSEKDGTYRNRRFDRHSPNDPAVLQVLHCVILEHGMKLRNFSVNFFLSFRWLLNYNVSRKFTKIININKKLFAEIIR